mmetsp:Transcript_16928/g.39005  ORF Transcript_16928/g.39005 Transcript_16928/m.39005 type:complete len:608 (+) Transcript_16928:402-2225(+)
MLMFCGVSWWLFCVCCCRRQRYLNQQETDDGAQENEDEISTSKEQDTATSEGTVGRREEANLEAVHDSSVISAGTESMAPLQLHTAQDNTTAVVDDDVDDDAKPTTISPVARLRDVVLQVLKRNHCPAAAGANHENRATQTPPTTPLNNMSRTNNKIIAVSASCSKGQLSGAKRLFEDFQDEAASPVQVKRQKENDDEFVRVRVGTNDEVVARKVIPQPRRRCGVNGVLVEWQGNHAQELVLESDILGPVTMGNEKPTMDKEEDMEEDTLDLGNDDDDINAEEMDDEQGGDDDEMQIDVAQKADVQPEKTQDESIDMVIEIAKEETKVRESTQDTSMGDVPEAKEAPKPTDNEPMHVEDEEGGEKEATKTTEAAPMAIGDDSQETKEATKETEDESMVDESTKNAKAESVSQKPPIFRTFFKRIRNMSSVPGLKSAPADLDKTSAVPRFGCHPHSGDQLSKSADDAMKHRRAQLDSPKNRVMQKCSSFSPAVALPPEPSTASVAKDSSKLSLLNEEIIDLTCTQPNDDTEEKEGTCQQHGNKSKGESSTIGSDKGSSSAKSQEKKEKGAGGLKRNDSFEVTVDDVEAIEQSVKNIQESIKDCFAAPN